MSDPRRWQIGLVGYGEVGRILAEDLRQQDIKVAAYDIKLGGEHGAPLKEHAARFGVTLAVSHAELTAKSDFIISAVTASQAVPVAKACAGAINQGTWFLDFNSASPGAKRRAAALIDGADGRYVEGAVMTSVPPYRIKVPLLLGGPGAKELEPLLNAIGFVAKVASDKLGVSSAVKMCRSIMIKGLEAMVIESFTTARAYGVEDAVLASLAETFPAINWEKQGAYFFQRVIEHGRRRAEEVREVAETVREAGLTPWSAQGTAERQAWVADLADEPRNLPAAPIGAPRRIAFWRRSSAEIQRAFSSSLCCRRVVREFVARELDQADQARGFADDFRGALGAELGENRANAFVGGIERQQRAGHVVLRVDCRYVDARQDFADAGQSLDGHLGGRVGPNGMVIDAAECAEHFHTPQRTQMSVRVLV
ncbi:3-hydroxyisobutyrate dehydrogenase-like beta-hydroxyacid dehydrogenase [Bradyrhizobium japonicum]|nr:3-hydroxyisobutyrate dehydrogenase-like beta-hydroxyacid dehydrogenase [Bradyrhizobium japonicum]MCP1958403.1 3-hydroxyisobutyrate dehydrogenase-like beta-hydroxyacid dehydrogenase [Bradyrhizobium japonicum]